MNKRRNFIRNSVYGSALLLSNPLVSTGNSENETENKTTISKTGAGLQKPLSIYINWASYDELSDNVKLTEELAFAQMDAAIKLKKAGVTINVYLMDMFWFDPDGGYRKWRKTTWSETGPDRWLEMCKSNNMLPGLWFSTNVLEVGGNVYLKPLPEWEDSLSTNKNSLCLFKGGYLNHLIGSMQLQYNKGIRVFKFDFADFKAATPEAEASLLPSEIVDLNEKAWRSALYAFRQKNPEVMLVAYNGYGGMQADTGSPYRKTVNTLWLDVFDALYCGDPRPSDIPCINFWRSKDIYSDHMVWQYAKNGVPLERIDNTAFMIGNTGTCYGRGKENWKGMLVLSLARGAFFQTMYGDLSLLTAADAAFFANTQTLFNGMYPFGKTNLFGGIPGKGEVFGYLSETPDGQLFTVCNPTQLHTKISLPGANKTKKGLVLFADAGFTPFIENQIVTLGPEQLAVIGLGKYANPNFVLGRGDNTLPIPTQTEKMSVDFKKSGSEVSGTFKAKQAGRYRLIFQQFKRYDIPLRLTGGGKPGAKTLGEINKIQVFAAGNPIKTDIHYDKIIWSGLSWATAEMDLTQKNIGQEIMMKYACQDSLLHDFKAVLYRVMK